MRGGRRPGDRWYGFTRPRRPGLAEHHFTLVCEDPDCDCVMPAVCLTSEIQEHDDRH